VISRTIALLLLAPAPLRLIRALVFLGALVAPNSSGGEVITLTGIIVGIDALENSIKLEQQQAVDRNVLSEVSVAKEVWNEADLAAGDNVTLSYDTNLQLVVAAEKAPPPTPKELRQKSLLDATDSFLEKQRETAVQLENQRQANNPTFTIWQQLHAEEARFHEQFLKAPPMVPADNGNKLVHNPFKALLLTQRNNTSREIAGYRRSYNAAVEKEKNLIDAGITSGRELLKSIAPLARDGYESDKRDELNRLMGIDAKYWEPKVWTAMLWIQDGEADKASATLRDVHADMEDTSFLVKKRLRIRPEAPPFLYETAHIYIRSLQILRNKKAISTFITKWDKKPYPDNDYYYIILLAKASRSMLLGNWAEARANCRKAVNVADLNEQGELVGWVYGDAAWVMSASLDADERDAVAAKDCVEKSLAICGDSCWVALRAKAAIHAAAGEWDEALECLEKAGDSSPLILADDLEAQRTAYNEKRIFVMPQP